MVRLYEIDQPVIFISNDPSRETIAAYRSQIITNVIGEFRGREYFLGT